MYIYEYIAGSWMYTYPFMHIPLEENINYNIH